MIDLVKTTSENQITKISEKIVKSKPKIKYNFFSNVEKNYLYQEEFFSLMLQFLFPWNWFCFVNGFWFEMKRIFCQPAKFS